jgi:hypothetical protein
LSRSQAEQGFLLTVIDFNKARLQGEARQDELAADEIRKEITARAQEFVEWMFPCAVVHKSGSYAVVGDIYGQPGESLYIHLTGQKAGMWKDFASAGDRGGDLIGLFMATNNFSNGDFPKTLEIINTEFLGRTTSRWLRTFTIHFEERSREHANKPRPQLTDRPPPSESYIYRDVSGNIIGVIRRHEFDAVDPKTGKPKKTFSVWDARASKPQAPTPRPLYRLPEIIQHHELVFTEGEKKADALASMGIEATCIMFGSDAVLEKVDWSPIAGKQITIWPDKDDAGAGFAKRLAPFLTSMKCEVLVIEPPANKPDKWDAADCIAEGGDADAIIAGAKLFGDDANAEAPNRQPLPRLLTAAQFVAGFTPPEYLIDGIMQRGYLYSLTARTGHGKTAVSMYIAQAIARGTPMHGKVVKAGTVLLLAGENPDDIRARFLVLADEFKFAARDIKMRFVAGVVDIEASMPVICTEAESIPDLVLVIVDTAAAYFNGDDTNSNSQQGAYARLLRQLSFLPGKPAVLVNCHPVKNAQKDNLLPMGGSAFLNEVDGNLTLWANSEKQTTLHWQGKFRGPEFEPLTFEMKTVTSDRVHDANGELMPSVVAEPVSDT